jgi:hypothetical protein
MRDKMEEALKGAGDWMLSRELHLDNYAGVISITITPGRPTRVHLTAWAAADCGVCENTSAEPLELSDGELFHTQQDDDVVISWITK